MVAVRARRTPKQRGYGGDITGFGRHALLAEMAVHHRQVVVEPRGHERARRRLPAIGIADVEDLATQHLGPDRRAAFPGQRVRPDEVVAFVVVPIVQQYGRRGIGNITGIDTGDPDLADRLREQPGLNARFGIEVVLEKVVRSQERPGHARCLQAALDRQFRGDVRDVVHLLGGMNGLVDETRHTGSFRHRHREQALDHFF